MPRYYPSKVKIGAQVFDILWLPTRDDAMLTDSSYGYTQDERNIIVINVDLHDTKKKMTLFHEIMHAVRMVNEPSTKPQAGAEYGEWEHYFIGIFENSLLAVFQDNPKLTKWLLQGEESEK
jgi:hypothetical protein